nr:hypothetical protein [Serratia inhibens]
MTTRIWSALLIALSVYSAEAAAKNQGHGTLSLGGEIVETPANCRRKPDQPLTSG